MSRMAWLVAVSLLLAACSPAPPPTPPPAPPVASGPQAPAPPPERPATAPPRTFGPVPEVLAQPAAAGGPQRVALRAGDTISKHGAYFLNVETGAGEAWVFPGAENPWWVGTISDDNRFVWGSGAKAGYLLDRQTGAVWQWNVEAVRPVLISDRGSLFAELVRIEGLQETGRYFWSGPDFRPAHTFTLAVERPWVSSALLSPDGQTLALLVQGATPALVLLDLRSGAQKPLAVPGAGGWIGAAWLRHRDGGIEIVALVSGGNRGTDMPRWTERMRSYTWQGEVRRDLEIPGSYTAFSPDGKWVAWQERDLLANLAPVTVVAEASTLKPHLKVLGASPCFNSVGSASNRWLADSSGLMLATTANQYRLLTLDGVLREPPGFAGLTWKGEPQPAPDKLDRFAIGRLQVLDGTRKLELKLEGSVTPRAGDAWGNSSRELRFTLPPKPGGAACFELPPMDAVALKAGEPVPEFPLVVRTDACVPLLEAGSQVACLARGTRLKPLPEWHGRPGLTWTDGWALRVQTESGQAGWIYLKDSPVTWAR